MTETRHICAAAALFATLVVGLSSCVAEAQSSGSPSETPAASVNPRGLSDFEWRLVRSVLEENKLELLEDEEAEGKTVEDIIVATEEVFTPEDLWPDWLNVFHITSKEHVIEREVLLQRGEAYIPELADESARNMRGPQVLSIALVMPVRGTKPDTVRILVVTKDLWSLRTNTNFLFEGSLFGDDFTLLFLSLSFTETNFLGLHKQAGLTSLLELDTLTLGEFVIDRRVWGSRIAASETAQVILNRDTGEVEGFRGALGVALPLYSLRREWGWGVATAGSTEIGRSFLGRDIRPFDDPDTAEVEELPYVWRQRFFSLDAGVTRSFGLKWKNNFSFGYLLEFTDFVYGENDADRAARDQATVEQFESLVLPRSELVSAIYAQYDFFQARFLSLRNFESYALPEDFRFGPSATVRVTHAEPGLGSDARFQSFGFILSQRWLLLSDELHAARRGDVLTVAAGYDTRLENNEFLDNELSASVRNYSPVFLWGRLVLQSAFIYRFEDLSNETSTLGGDSGLRGYEPGAFIGRSRLVGHVEWRTLPIELYTFHLGLVAFYDYGALATEEDLSDRQNLHGVGTGMRILNPSSNRIVFRVDWGLPLTPPPGVPVFPGRFTAGFEQAF